MEYYTLETKLNDFSAAHRILNNYSGKCRNLHGHNYAVTVFLQSTCLDESDFVMDFSTIKQIFNAWINNNVDHSVIVSNFDQSLLKFLEKEKQKHYIITENKNTSVEVLAKHFYDKFNSCLLNNPNVTLYKIQLHETATSSAIYQQE